MVSIYLAGELIPAASIPDLRIEMRAGATTFTLTLTTRVSLTATQIAACTLSSVTTIRLVAGTFDIIFTGIVNEMNVRTGYALVKLVDVTGA